MNIKATILALLGISVAGAVIGVKAKAESVFKGINIKFAGFVSSNFSRLAQSQLTIRFKLQNTSGTDVSLSGIRLFLGAKDTNGNTIPLVASESFSLDLTGSQARTVAVPFQFDALQSGAALFKSKKIVANASFMMGDVEVTTPEIPVDISIKGIISQLPSHLQAVINLVINGRK